MMCDHQGRDSLLQIMFLKKENDGHNDSRNQEFEASRSLVLSIETDSYLLTYEELLSVGRFCSSFVRNGLRFATSLVTEQY
jgi:hypothetical protein